MQKPILIILSTLVIPVMSFTTSAQQPPLGPGAGMPSAQPTTPAPPPADPFARNARPSAAPAAESTKNSKNANLFATVETWALSETDALAIMEIPDSHHKGYSHLLGFAESGKARLVGLRGVSFESGQKPVLQSADEVRYPVEFDPPERAGEIPFPTAWETRNVGDLFEMEASLRPDGQVIDMNITPLTVVLEGFIDDPASPSVAPISQPRFDHSKTATAASLRSGHAIIFATTSPIAVKKLPDQDREVHLQTVRLVAQPPVPPALESAVGDSARVEFLIYKLDRVAAAHVLREHPDALTSYAVIRDMLTKGDAELEFFRAFITRSGNSATIEDQSEYKVTDGMNPPKPVSVDIPAMAMAPASPASFLTFDVGPMVDVEADIDREAKVVNMRIQLRLNSYLGTIKVGGIGDRYPKQPLISSRRISTRISSGLGQTVFVGTISQPRSNGANGREDDGKASMVYVRVMPITH